MSTAYDDGANAPTAPLCKACGHHHEQGVGCGHVGRNPIPLDERQLTEDVRRDLALARLALATAMIDNGSTLHQELSFDLIESIACEPSLGEEIRRGIARQETEEPMSLADLIGRADESPSARRLLQQYEQRVDNLDMDVIRRASAGAILARGARGAAPMDDHAIIFEDEDDHAIDAEFARGRAATLSSDVMPPGVNPAVRAELPEDVCGEISEVDSTLPRPGQQLTKAAALSDAAAASGFRLPLSDAAAMVQLQAKPGRGPVDGEVAWRDLRGTAGRLFSHSAVELREASETVHKKGFPPSSRRVCEFLK